MEALPEAVATQALETEYEARVQRRAPGRVSQSRAPAPEATPPASNRPSWISAEPYHPDMVHRPSRACPHAACRSHTRPEARIVGHASYRALSTRRRRWRCKECARTFAATTGTVYWRLRCSKDEFDQVARLAAEGMPKAAIARALGRSRSTIDRWLAKAAQSATRFSEHVLRSVDPVEVQMDELKTHVGRRDHEQFVFTCLEVWSRLWLATHVGRRTLRSTILFARRIRRTLRLFGPRPLFVSDKFKYYEQALRRVFGIYVVYVRIWKQISGNRVVGGKPELVFGSPLMLAEAMARSEDSKKLNTAYVERLNLHVRRSVSCLQRKTNAHARSSARLEELVELARCYYNFVRPHSSLRFGGKLRTPAQQAGIVARRLSFREVFLSDMPRAGRRDLCPRWRTGIESADTERRAA